MLTIYVMLKDYTLILAYKLIMMHLCCDKMGITPSAGSFGIPLEHTPWACLIADTYWIVERLEDVDLVATRLSIR